MSDYITVARVVKTQGRRGEVAAEILTDFPRRFYCLKTVAALAPNGARACLTLENFWFHKQWVVFKFSGVDSITAAEKWVGAEIQIPRAEAVPLPDKMYYRFDLVGCELLDVRSNEQIGAVVDFWSDAGHPLLVVREPKHQREILIPFAEEICKRIDTHAKKIWVELPEGLLTLNP